MSYRIVILGLSITSSWGNGHATTYRGLVRELARLGVEVTFLERDQPWYAAHRDLPQPPYGTTHLYDSLPALRRDWHAAIAEADAVIVGSFTPDGIAIGEWVTRTAGGVAAFYDIDTPATLAALEANTCEYLAPALIPEYDLYLSFTGGPTLERLERYWRARRARPLYCAFDPDAYYPEPVDTRWDLGYLGTYSDDRQPHLESLLLEPARARPTARFVVAGAQYPLDLDWPNNVARYEHVPPSEHRAFYNAQRFTLNVTRDAMRRAGYAPSVRLFEAAACGVPIISDRWPGIDQFFTPGEEILLADTAEDVLSILHNVSDSERRTIGSRARERALREHTAAQRAQDLVAHLRETARETDIHIGEPSRLKADLAGRT